MAIDDRVRELQNGSFPPPERILLDIYQEVKGYLADGKNTQSSRTSFSLPLVVQRSYGEHPALKHLLGFAETVYDRESMKKELRPAIAAEVVRGAYTKGMGCGLVISVGCLVGLSQVGLAFLERMVLGGAVYAMATAVYTQFLTDRAEAAMEKRIEKLLARKGWQSTRDLVQEYAAKIEAKGS